MEVWKEMYMKLSQKILKALIRLHRIFFKKIIYSLIYLL